MAAFYTLTVILEYMHMKLPSIRRKKKSSVYQSGINKIKVFDGFPVQIGMEHLSNCKHFDHKAVMTETWVSTVRET